MEALKERRVVAISGGWRHTAAADDAGNLYTWGWNKVSPHGLQQPHILLACQTMLSHASSTFCMCSAAIESVGQQSIFQAGSPLQLALES